MSFLQTSNYTATAIKQGKKKKHLPPSLQSFGLAVLEADFSRSEFWLEIKILFVTLAPRVHESAKDSR